MSYGRLFIFSHSIVDPLISFRESVLSFVNGWIVMPTLDFMGTYAIKAFCLDTKLYDFAILFVALSIVFYTTYRLIKMGKARNNGGTKKKDEPITYDIKNRIEIESERIRSHILETSKIYILIVQGFADENEKQLKATCKKVNYLEKTTRTIKEDCFNSFATISAGQFDLGHYFIQAMDYLGELTSPLKQLSQPIYQHVHNKHKGLSEAQKEDLLLLLEEVTGFFNYLVHIEKEQRFGAVPEMVQRQKYIIELIEELQKKQINHLIKGQGKTRSSILLLECYAESKNLILYTINLLKAHRDFHKLSY